MFAPDYIIYSVAIPLSELSISLLVICCQSRENDEPGRSGWLAVRRKEFRVDVFATRSGAKAGETVFFLRM